VNVSDFTPGQRRIVILMIIVVIVVLAVLAGFVVTSLENLESLSPATLQPFVSSPPTPLPTPTVSPVPSPVPEEGIWSDQIAHQVETLRALSPRAEVPLNFLDEREITTLLSRLYADRGPEARLWPYIAMGLLPDTPISIRAHPVAGVYVPEQEQFYIATGRQESGADDQALLAHAYAHALQDRHFDLGAMDARAATTDATLAVQALVEGDATLLTAFYRYEDLAAADWGHLAELIVWAEQPSYGEKLDPVRAWARLQQFPYWEGRRFTYTLFQIGGWEIINQAYTDPPRGGAGWPHRRRRTRPGRHPRRGLDGAPSGYVGRVHRRPVS